MKRTRVLLTIGVAVILSTNFSFADQGSLESNEYNKGEVKVITQKDIKQNAKDYSNYNLIISPFNQEYDYLDKWGTTFTYNGDGELSVMGYTRSKQDADHISVKVYLQQYDESRNTWVSIDTISNSEKQDYYSRVVQSYIAPVGYKYRVYAVHKATIGSKTESTSSYSKEISTY